MEFIWPCNTTYFKYEPKNDEHWFVGVEMCKNKPNKFSVITIVIDDFLVVLFQSETYMP